MRAHRGIVLPGSDVTVGELNDLTRRAREMLPEGQYWRRDMMQFGARPQRKAPRDIGKQDEKGPKL